MEPVILAGDFRGQLPGPWSPSPLSKCVGPPPTRCAPHAYPGYPYETGNLRRVTWRPREEHMPGHSARPGWGSRHQSGSGSRSRFRPQRALGPASADRKQHPHDRACASGPPVCLSLPPPWPLPRMRIGLLVLVRAAAIRGREWGAVVFLGCLCLIVAVRLTRECLQGDVRENTYC